MMGFTIHGPLIERRNPSCSQLVAIKLLAYLEFRLGSKKRDSDPPHHAHDGGTRLFRLGHIVSTSIDEPMVINDHHQGNHRVSLWLSTLAPIAPLRDRSVG